MASLLQLINILQQLISNLLMHITSSRSWQQALQLLTAGKTAQLDPPAAAVTDWFAQMDPETAHQLLPNPWAASQQAYALHGNVNAVNFATEVPGTFDRTTKLQVSKQICHCTVLQQQPKQMR